MESTAEKRVSQPCFLEKLSPIRIAEKRLPGMSKYFFILMCDGIVSNQELLDR